MNYELAKLLKGAGFPQKIQDLLNEVEYKGKKYQKPTDPTLEELIASCGDRFSGLYKGGELGWWATNGEGIQGEGSTPLEAVALLWLLLNKKLEVVSSSDTLIV
jgi:hypothetical protein